MRPSVFTVMSLFCNDRRYCPYLALLYLPPKPQPTKILARYPRFTPDPGGPSDVRQVGVVVEHSDNFLKRFLLRVLSECSWPHLEHLDNFLKAVSVGPVALRTTHRGPGYGQGRNNRPRFHVRSALVPALQDVTPHRLQMPFFIELVGRCRNTEHLLDPHTRRNSDFEIDHGLDLRMALSWEKRPDAPS